MLDLVLSLLSGALLVLLPRLPAFSVEGRRLTRIKQMSDLYQSLPDIEGKEQLSELLRDEVVDLVQFQRLAEQRAQSRRRVMTTVIKVGLAVVFAVAVGLLVVIGMNTPGKEWLVGVGAMVFGALTTLVGLIVPRSRSQSTDEFANLVMQAMQRRQKHEE